MNVKSTRLMKESAAIFQAMPIADDIKFIDSKEPKEPQLNSNIPLMAIYFGL